MCEFCGVSGRCCVCGHDQGAGGVLELVPGWDVAGEWHGPDVLPLAEPVLAVVDVDDIDTDLRYALRQLRSAMGAEVMMRTYRDHVARALDALERIENRVNDAAAFAARL